MNRVQHEIFKFLGIVRDIEPIELMPGTELAPGKPTAMSWTNGRNVHFDNASTVRSDGFASIADPLPDGAVPIFHLNVLTTNVSWWLWVDYEDPAAPKIWATDGNVHYNITPTTPLTGGGPGEWTGTILNGLPVLNNGTDPPHYWLADPNEPMEPLPGWPDGAVARSIRAYKFHLIAMDVSEGGVRVKERVMWSDSADAGSVPSTWIPGPDNDAGDVLLAATPGAVVDGEKLRDVFVLYKQHSTYTMQYVGGQFIFNIQPLFITSGVQSINCVKELRGYHFVFADDDVITHDGNTFKSIVDKRIRDEIFRSINPDNQKYCHLAVRVPNDEIWIVVPSVDADYCDVAAVYSFTDNVFGFRRLPQIAYVGDGIIPQGKGVSWDESEDIWDRDPRKWDEANYSRTADRLLMAQPSPGKLHQVGISQDEDGEPMSAYVERRDFTVGGQANIWDNVIIRTLYPVITGKDGDIVKIQFSATKFPNEAIQWGPVLYYTIGKTRKLDRISHGRFMNLRISSEGGSEWTVHRIGFDYSEASKY